MNDPAQATEFKRFHLNIWGQTENRAIDMRQRPACGGELRALVDRRCYCRFSGCRPITSGSGSISVELVDEGFTCVEVGQGFQKISEPTKKLLELVISGKCRHANHEVLRWNADCLSLKSDGNDNVRPSKPNRMTSSKRIDGMAAIIFALSRIIVQTNKKSVYKDRGPLVLG